MVSPSEVEPGHTHTASLRVSLPACWEQLPSPAHHTIPAVHSQLPGSQVSLSSLCTPAQGLPANCSFLRPSLSNPTVTSVTRITQYDPSLCVVPRPCKSGQERGLRDREELAWVRQQSQAKGEDQEAVTGRQVHTSGLCRSILRLTPQLPAVWLNTKGNISPGGQKPEAWMW